ncbi:hypothetical protein AKO1_008323 [Acrasis kona]|uniref:Multidrug and toxin extrusion protein n=1 Tax=Acrasis kona TaxID=1008807 RepID=A0AAW2YN29_9EUKA
MSDDKDSLQGVVFAEQNDVELEDASILDKIEEESHPPIPELEFNTPYSYAKTFFIELLNLLKLAFPIFVTWISFSTMMVVDNIFLGSLDDSRFIAAATLSSAYTTCLVYIPVGMVGAQDTLISQAFGMKKTHVIKLVLSRTILITTVVFIPIIFLFVFPDAIFRYMVLESDQQVAAFAVTFNRLIVPGLYPFLIYRVFASYLTSQSRVYAPMIIGILCNLCNILFNSLLVSGIGYQGLGFNGAPIGTSLARLIMALLAITIVTITQYRSRRNNEEVPDILPEMNKEAIKEYFKQMLNWVGIKEFIKLAIPACFSQCLGLWAFQCTSIAAARIGEKSIAAHGLVLNLGIQTFMIPATIGVATSIRVGQRLGQRDAAGAKRVCYTGIVTGGAAMCICGIVIVLIRKQFTRWFVDDDQVADIASKIMIVSAYCQVFDGVQSVCRGVLNGTGRQNVGAICLFISYYLVGIPLGCFLAFYMEWELFGLYIGLATGLTLITIFTLSYLYFKLDWNEEVEKAIKRVEKSDTK